MLDLARDIIGSQPILTAFLAIGVGYLVGQISIFGFSLGVGAVLFVGLAIGAFAPKAQIIGPIGLTGLIMFLYGIGILYGRQFFEGMVGAGQKYNLLALVACLAGLGVALLLGQMFNIKIGHTLGQARQRGIGLLEQPPIEFASRLGLALQDIRRHAWVLGRSKAQARPKRHPHRPGPPCRPETPRLRRRTRWRGDAPP